MYVLFFKNFRYTPPRLWGYSGHIQTIIQGAISRLHCPLVNGRRTLMKASDGATVTYDLYQPIEVNSVNSKFVCKIFYVLKKIFRICIRSISKKDFFYSP